MKKVLALAISLVLVIGLQMTVDAGTRDNTLYEIPGKPTSEVFDAKTEDELFQEKENIKNDFTGLYVNDATFRNGGYVFSSRSHFSTRYLAKTLHITADRTVKEYMSVVIPDGMTLTVDKGVTLVIKGDIQLQGKLVNNGTIILDGKRDVSVFELREHSDYSSFQVKRDSEWEQQEELTLYGNLTCNGALENPGNIAVRSGTIDNGNGGTITNTGTITVNNGKNRVHGITNTTKANAEKTVATIVNSGDIDLGGPAEYGILSNQGSVIQNEGTIVAANGAVVKGKVTGNPVKTQA